MSENLEKYSEKNNLIKAKIEQDFGAGGLEVGDIFIKVSHSDVAIKVTKIEYTEDERYKNSDIEYKIKISYRETDNWELTEWEERERVSNYHDFKYHHINGATRIKNGDDVSEYREKAQKVISGEIDIESLNDTETDVINNETALISKNSKTNLTALQNNLEDKKKNAELIQAFVSIEMEKKKRELETVRQKLNGVIDVFRKKIGKIMRVITTIELYLGIDEELFQIQEGELAPKDTPICFRQAVLYMDEEIGHYENGGLDFTNIDWFDNWLITNDNYKKLLPEEKGLVVFRPRRHEKDYGDDVRYNAAMNQENKYRTYLLIRNGECLYRVYTENIVILPRLFPKKDELQKLMLEIQHENMSSWDEEKKKDKFDDLLHQYKKRAILMQGLIDRTEVFHPLPVEKINMFDMDNLDGKVIFIYDDEATLPSGRLPFWEWHKEINDKIGKGSRVLLTHFNKRNDDVSDRIYYYCNEYNLPSPPSRGIYVVEEYFVEESKEYKKSDFEKLKLEWDDRGFEYKVVKTRENAYVVNWQDNFHVPKIYEDGITVKGKFPHLTILYNPGDTVYGPWGTYDPHERKKRIRLKIYKSDNFILNYDQISLDDIEFYLTSRVDRPNYLSMLPLLNDIKKWRLVEIENEKNFAKLVYAQIYTNKIFKGQSDDFVYSKIWQTIDWWKFKNMWKRPIDKDDAKALRMITKKLLREDLD